MSLDLARELQHAHALLDLLTPAKLGAVRSLMEVMLNDDSEPVTDEDRRRFHDGEAWFE